MSLSAVDNHNPPHCEYESTVLVHATVNYPRHTRNAVEIYMVPDRSDGRREFTTYQFTIPMIFDCADGDAKIADDGITAKVMSIRVSAERPDDQTLNDAFDYDRVDGISLGEMLASAVHPFMETSRIELSPQTGAAMAFVAEAHARLVFNALTEIVAWHNEEPLLK